MMIASTPYLEDRISTQSVHYVDIPDIANSSYNFESLRDGIGATSIGTETKGKLHNFNAAMSPMLNFQRLG